MNLPKRKDIKVTESPIEDRLLYWFREYRMFPETQYPIGAYRADFAFPEKMLVVEADGKEFHSSEEKAKRDAERDEYMQRMGYKVMRFSGSNIYREPWNVVKKVLEYWYPRRQPTEYHENIDGYSTWLTEENDTNAFLMARDDVYKKATQLAENEKRTEEDRKLGERIIEWNNAKQLSGKKQNRKWIENKSKK